MSENDLEIGEKVEHRASGSLAIVVGFHEDDPDFVRVSEGFDIYHWAHRSELKKTDNEG